MFVFKLLNVFTNKLKSFPLTDYIWQFVLTRFNTKSTAQKKGFKFNFPIIYFEKNSSISQINTKKTNDDAFLPIVSQ